MEAAFGRSLGALGAGRARRDDDLFLRMPLEQWIAK
jgi:hypothetical protein